MKQYLIILFSIVFVIILSCNKSTTEPPEDPPGYQRDIPWPSLADSPWPMNNHDPQRTGRSNFVGPEHGILEKIIPTDELQAGLIIGQDSTIYCTSSQKVYGGVYAFYPDGTQKWRLKIRWSDAAPIALSDSSVLILNTQSIYCIKSDSTIKWKYDDNELIANTMSVLAVGKDGKIYYVINNKLKVLNSSGSFDYSVYDESLNCLPVNNIAFSPDGNYIYLGGDGFSLVAVDLISKKIIWRLPGSRGRFPPLVDCFGNIYYSRTINNGNSIFSISPEGLIRWELPIEGKVYCELTMDKNGNIFGGDAKGNIYKIDFGGNLVWKIRPKENNLDLDIDAGLVCDTKGTLYAYAGKYYYAINNDGTIKWTFSFESLGIQFAGASNAPSIFNNKLYVAANNGNNIYIIK